MSDMRLLALVVVCGLMVGQDALQGSDSAQRTPGTGVFRCPPLSPSGSVPSALIRRSTGELLEEDPSTCFSLRENEEQRQLLCNDRRSKFNFNPFGLRFGKRFNSYIYRRAVKRARRNQFSPLSMFSRELEVPT
ncbi:kisspeptin 2 [Notolabrus celidotus]|uniref:kisspeptin 2 n=1 Tax=Notolabrus celidotus TaxID=1203425 RepID=UPI00148F7335|nr:kisspeptin 2 [Notolabrus celidotus]